VVGARAPDARGDQEGEPMKLEDVSDLQRRFDELMNHVHDNKEVQLRLLTVLAEDITLELEAASPPPSTPFKRRI
jgi:hypothetical protein